MSSLDGHRKVTQQAVKEIQQSYPHQPVAKSLGETVLATAVVMRDVFDLSGGHWADYGQKHHFMRRFDGQSPYQAYLESVEWIQSNAIKSAQNLSECFKKSDSINISIINWNPLGTALHALQDSFSQGHALRTENGTAEKPGAIEHIKTYAGEEKEGHTEHDKLWEGEIPGEFSFVGRQAINASKALIVLIVKTAQQHDSSSDITVLADWNDFKKTWLVVAKNLSQTRDIAIDLIEEFHMGARRGYYNWLTLNFNEQGLADAIVSKLGNHSNQVYAVFERLDSGGYSTDIDDVALAYVKRIKNHPLIAASVRSNQALVQLLIKSMDEGWTSRAEKKCIKFLKEKI